MIDTTRGGSKVTPDVVLTPFQVKTDGCPSSAPCYAAELTSGNITWSQGSESVRCDAEHWEAAPRRGSLCYRGSPPPPTSRYSSRALQHNSRKHLHSHLPTSPHLLIPHLPLSPHILPIHLLHSNISSSPTSSHPTFSPPTFQWLLVSYLLASLSPHLLPSALVLDKCKFRTVSLYCRLEPSD